MLSIARPILFSLALFLCTTSYGGSFEDNLSKADQTTTRYLKSISKNSEYPKYTQKNFLDLFRQMGCADGARLSIDPETNLFSIKNAKDRACVKKWADMFVEALNERYNFSQLDSEYTIELISDISRLESIAFEDIETNVRKRFLTLFKNKVANLRNEVIEENELERSQSRSRRFEVLKSSSQKISDSIKDGYTSPPQAAEPPKVDYTCLTRCQKTGHMYKFCQSKCQY